MPMQDGAEFWADEDLFIYEDWCDIQNRINDLIEDPDGDCPDVPLLECPEKPHIWTKKDIEDVRLKLEEICDENEGAWTDFEDDQLWSAEILNEIEEAIREGWCNCCWDCPNAVGIDGPSLQSYMQQYMSYSYEKEENTTFDLGHVNQTYESSDAFGNTYETTYANIYIDPNDPDGLSDTRLELGIVMFQSYDAAILNDQNWNKYRTLQAAWQSAKDQVQRELDRANERLEELEQMRDDICEEAQEDDSKQGACDNAEEAVAEQEEDIAEIEDNKEQIDAEFDRLKEEADTNWDEMAVSAAANQTAHGAYPARPGSVNHYQAVTPTIEAPSNMWDPERVFWDKERFGCDYHSAPRTSEDWLELIGEDDDNCWRPWANQCNTGWAIGYKCVYAELGCDPRLDPSVWKISYSGGYLSNGQWVRRARMTSGRLLYEEFYNHKAWNRWNDLVHDEDHTVALGWRFTRPGDTYTWAWGASPNTLKQCEEEDT